VVIFQQDLRRGVEYLAAWKPYRWRIAAAEDAPTVVDTLVDALTMLAEERIGALLVVRGSEPIDRHLRGGIPLKGRLSIPILHSIFSPKSQGHDGAVIIENNRIDRFGVHLPLSQNLAKLHHRGTRHTAALGLAERSDSLIIVVSEERGTISLAHEGAMELIASTAVLKERVTGFWQKHFPDKKKTFWHTWGAHHLWLKLLSAGMACVLWFGLAYRVEMVQRTYDDVPIEYRNLPAGWVIDENLPTKMKVTLRGPERAFSTFDAKTLKIALDMSNPTEGFQEIMVTDKLLGLPADLSVLGADTPPITVNAFRETRIELPIKVELDGVVPEGYRVARVMVSPDRVAVLIPQKELGRYHAIKTFPIRLDNLEKDGTIQAFLDLPENVRFPRGKPPTVLVTIVVQKIDKEKTSASRMRTPSENLLSSAGSLHYHAGKLAIFTQRRNIDEEIFRTAGGRRLLDCCNEYG
jgi:hypothetical protein